MLRKIAYILLASSILFSCKKKEKINLPTILITPSEIIQTLSPKEEVKFSINLEAEGGLDKFEITESINGSSTVILYDSLFSEGNNANITFSYEMPNTHTSTEIILSFKIYDKMNNVGSGARKLLISPSDSLLKEISNLVLYSGYSNNKNGFLIDYDSTLNSDSTFYGDLDIVTSDTSDILDLEWSSPKGNKFVLFNGFNYDSASFKTVSEAYLFGNEQSKVSKLEIGDIIITKIANPIKYEFALIKITNIVDEADSTLDRYVFNIKK